MTERYCEVCGGKLRTGIKYCWKHKGAGRENYGNSSKTYLTHEDYEEIADRTALEDAKRAYIQYRNPKNSNIAFPISIILFFVSWIIFGLFFNFIIGFYIGFVLACIYIFYSFSEKNMQETRKNDIKQYIKAKYELPDIHNKYSLSVYVDEKTISQDVKLEIANKNKRYVEFLEEYVKIAREERNAKLKEEENEEEFAKKIIKKEVK